MPVVLTFINKFIQIFFRQVDIFIESNRRTPVFFNTGSGYVIDVFIDQFFAVSINFYDTDFYNNTLHVRAGFETSPALPVVRRFTGKRSPFMAAKPIYFAK